MPAATIDQDSDFLQSSAAAFSTSSNGTTAELQFTAAFSLLLMICPEYGDESRFDFILKVAKISRWKVFMESFDGK